jgi:hypothetical protein
LSVLDTLKALDEQRAKVLNEAKSAALQKAQDAIGELSQLGFHYKLIESSGLPTAKGPQNERAGAHEQLMQKGGVKVEAPSSGFDQTLPGS